VEFVTVDGNFLAESIDWKPWTYSCSKTSFHSFEINFNLCFLPKYICQCGLVVGVPTEFVATDLDLRLRFPALPDFMRSSGSGTGFTQPREDNGAS
jgi:hypothetical protein